MTKKVLCSYCGTGCQLEYNEIAKKLSGKEYCLKGVRQTEIINKNRTDKILFRRNKNTKFQEKDWNFIYKFITDKIKNTDPKKIAIYSSGQIQTEDYYIINKLFKGFIGTNNVDSNSRTCVASAAVGLSKSIGVDYVPGTKEDVLKTDLILIIGANPAKAHPVFFDNYIKKAKKLGKKIVVIDPRYSKTAEIADLYIDILPGQDIELFNSISAYIYKHNLYDRNFIDKYIENKEEFFNFLEKWNIEKGIKNAGITKKQFDKLIEMIIQNKKMVSIWAMGINQSYNGVNKNLSIMNLHLLLGRIFEEGNNPFPETGQPNAMGGREVGGLSHLLAVGYSFLNKDIYNFNIAKEKIAKFWNTDINKIPDEQGLTAVEIFEEALYKNKFGGIDILFVVHTDLVYHLPNRNMIEKAIKNIPLVIEINAYKNSETSKFSNIILPASPWGEKQGHMTSMDRIVGKNNSIKEINKISNQTG